MSSFCAQRERGTLAGAIFHGDHGAQYTSQDYAKLSQHPPSALRLRPPQPHHLREHHVGRYATTGRITIKSRVHDPGRSPLCQVEPRLFDLLGDAIFDRRPSLQSQRPMDSCGPRRFRMTRLLSEPAMPEQLPRATPRPASHLPAESGASESPNATADPISSGSTSHTS